ncbi:MAG: sulfatase [Armatimonadetes bacterium]|nr:sulfatase [Armatimonadota bacterium]
MDRRDFVNWLGLGACALVAGSAQAQAARRPNILYMMSDDHAAHAISAYGSRVNQTPNIDRLATGGMRFNHIYATNSICTPSRATILTGQYSHVNGVPVFNPLPNDRPVVSEMMQAAGYWTSMVGKWHLGSDPRGFDQWEILPGQGAYVDPMLYNAQGRKKYTGHCTDVVTDIALGFLKDRPRDKPFFSMVHHKAPHRNWIPAERHAAAWRDKVIPEPDTLFDDYAGRADAIRNQKQSIARDLTPTDVKQAPPAGLAGDDLTRWKYQRYMQDYLACVQGVDESVGRILDWLDTEGLADNTLVIYTSDQGFFLGDHGLFDKRFMYEESDQMPFLARWPGHITPNRQCDALGINCDFAPTFLEVAGRPTPPTMQGRSLVQWMEGRKIEDWRDSFYYRYYHDPGDHNTAAQYGVRTNTHKLIYFWRLDQWECYDLTKDPKELRNIYHDPAAQPVVAKLKAELARLKKEVGDTEDRYARNEDWPKGGVDGGPRPIRP